MGIKFKPIFTTQEKIDSIPIAYGQFICVTDTNNLYIAYSIAESSIKKTIVKKLDGSKWTQIGNEIVNTKESLSSIATTEEIYYINYSHSPSRHYYMLEEEYFYRILSLIAEEALNIEKIETSKGSLS